MSRPPPPDSAGPDIAVGVEVQHLPAHSRPDRQLFTYVITVHNRSDQTWQLLARHWEIEDATGRVTVVDGEGVVGEQPVLPPGGSFTYDSFVTLEATPGRMHGHYVVQDAWGVRAQVPIAAFVLDVPRERVLN
ncbi:ApaG protein [Deinococcus metalli]|uniref:ApaG protein n=1 Tax=Deinococcus metalli TaxID=1141878 RepID=A0A7W8NRQ7_9DEIO|nr:Co2+/Mg2+ efflux protein ApaG [Deinococcus metalli]MBB5377148.1 ApaG protein [Deinococcus metalli]GHF48632.1 protein ApaG [Deinococcus metalli]